MGAVSHSSIADQPREIEAVLNYTLNTGVRPVNYTFDPPEGVPRNSGVVDARVIVIRNARRLPRHSIDINGFELLPHRSSLSRWAEFEDAERVVAVDYPQIAELLRARMSADKIIIFDHTLRASSATPGNAGLREPVRRVHDDQTLDSAPRRVARQLPPDEVAWRLRRRFAIVNIWRPVEGPVLQAPLAICDARSIRATDLLPSDLIYPDWVGETYAFTFNRAHRWYWFPHQTPAEATLIKIYDSAIDGRARLTAHTAFDDPTSPPRAPVRRSIELRAMVFW